MDFTAAYTGVDGAQIYIGADNQTTITATRVGDGVSGIYADKADIRPSSQATGLIGPTYQRVAAATVYDTAGFLPYLEFNGLSWSMSTNSIDFSAGDKMTVWAGVRKLAENNSGQCLFELSSNSITTNGSFWLLDVGLPNFTFGFYSRGTTLQTAYPASGETAPKTRVLCGQSNIAAPNLSIRYDGVQAAQNTSSQGTGNFGNYPGYIGERQNGTCKFIGNLYSIIVRGAQSTQSQIEATESWVNGKTGAY
jgi:hypothetical protein